MTAEKEKVESEKESVENAEESAEKVAENAPETEEKSKKKGKKRLLPLALGILLPILLTALFQVLRSNRPLMDFWVFRILTPVEQTLSLLWSVIPLSSLEVLIAACVLFHLFWLIRTAGLFFRERREIWPADCSRWSPSGSGCWPGSTGSGMRPTAPPPSPSAAASPQGPAAWRS